jgi:hypothetical protein
MRRLGALSLCLARACCQRRASDLFAAPARHRVLLLLHSCSTPTCMHRVCTRGTHVHICLVSLESSKTRRKIGVLYAVRLYGDFVCIYQNDMKPRYENNSGQRGAQRRGLRAISRLRTPGSTRSLGLGRLATAQVQAAGCTALRLWVG